MAASHPVEQKTVALQYGAWSQAAVVIAEHLAAGFHLRGFTPEVRTLRDAAALNLSRFAGAVLIVPVPLNRDEKDFLEFVRAQKETLERMPVAFISMSAARQSREAREGTTQNDEARRKSAQLVDDTRASLDRLFAQTGWRPPRQWPIAGSITYMRFNFIVRLILKLLATGPVKPSGRLDDWKALNDFLEEFEREIRANAS